MKFRSNKSLALVLCATTLMGALSAHANTSASLFVGGTVGDASDLVITPTGTNNTTLDIVNGETAKEIAIVTETSNNPNGYKIQAYAINGYLKFAAVPSQTVNYQISYDGGAYTSLSTSAAPVDLKTSGPLTAKTTDTSTILINVIAEPNAAAGSYGDLITISMIDQ